MGVNTFLSKNGSPTIIPTECDSFHNRRKRIPNQKSSARFKQRHADNSEEALKRLQHV
ncbi:MAG: hypothetical protein U0T32_14930 [Chitinophagales bacterium]